jgi:HSP20 family protein
MFSLMPRRVSGAITRMENPFEWVRREFAPLFDRAFPVLPLEARWEPHWGLEMNELENEYVVRAEVPGFEPSELEVNLSGNVLTIGAEHKRPEGATERPLARLERVLTLPVGVNADAVEARYHHGILEVHVPKTPEAMPRRIEVKTGA